MSKLWYNEQAKEWDEALPIGNGRLGAMIYGGTDFEELQLNEESIWYGGKVDRINEDALENLSKIRELIFNGKINEAERLMKYAMSGVPESMHAYQSLGNIYFQFYGFGNIVDYKRSLDLDKAVYEQKFRDEDTIYTREIFASNKADIIVIHLKAEGTKKLKFDVHMRREKYFDGIHKIGDNGISLYGNLGKGGFDFNLCLTAKIKNGDLKVIGEHIVVNNASEAILYFSADTTYHIETEFEEDLEKAVYGRIINAESRKLSDLLNEHIADYQTLFNRVEFELEGKEEYENLPTNERIKKFSEKHNQDVGFSKLYFDFGRYLLISCSRKGTLPATLQGLWNHHMTPPWESKYTVNINTQMNYWPAESCNLSECHEPLFELIKKLSENGKKTARKMYNANGWVVHHNTDIWADTAPQDIWIPASFWVMSGAWLCTHIWSHYEYTLDDELLKEYFPIIRSCAEFYLDFLVEKDGYKVTCPSVSPENTYIMADGTKGSITYGATIDNQILRDLFTECIDGAKILGIDDELNKRIVEERSKLIPTKIASDGTIMEWPKEYIEAEPGHRHISHLYALYPSSQIVNDKSANLAQAARNTLEKRLKNGGGHTGWSRAWIINFYARLWDGDEAYEHLKALYASSTYLNLFDKHPPFQIDGNFGATAAIAEMIVQSSLDRVVLLPALPKAWKKGSLKGIKIKGNGTIDIEWKNGKLLECAITFANDIATTIKYKDKEVNIEFKAFETVKLVPDIIKGIKTIKD